MNSGSSAAPLAIPPAPVCSERAPLGSTGEDAHTRTRDFQVCLTILSSLSLLPPSCSPIHSPGARLPNTCRCLPVTGLSPVGVCLPVCVEVPSETEAVQGTPMKLRCISCMKREEVEATTVVEWFYRPEGGKDFLVRPAADSGLSFAGLCCCVLGSRESGGRRIRHTLALSFQSPDSSPAEN